MATSAVDKVNQDKKIKIVRDLPAGMAWANEGDSMVVSTPKEVNQIMATIPQGSVITITELREYLAKKHGTTITCPISTGIFINLSAKAAEEMRVDGATEIVPFWRTLKKDGELNPKFPGFPDQQKTMLELEGFTVIQRRKRYFVENYEINIFDLREKC